MGTGQSSPSPKPSFDANSDVNFDHFQILRAIGKGSFGKVCIVQKKDTKKMFAMKYMNKAMCARHSAISNVVRELDMLTRLDHPFIVNLWYAFQDEEDMFMVVDLFLGGDLRYHMQQDEPFGEERVKFYLCELALVLDYLRTQRIIHRDIKPDNILLDEEGHCHLTDFNVATQLEEGELATATSGTRPYMAPEVFGVAINERRGYSFPIDWWSLGVSLFEMLRKRRPFSVPSGSSLQDTWATMISTKGQFFHLHNVSDGMKEILRLLLEFEPKDRLSSLAQLQKHSYVADIDFDAMLSFKMKPPFTPLNDQLNCDPTYELEEMIIETKPLHKKKKRLAKQNSKQTSEVMQTLCCQLSICEDATVDEKEDLDIQKRTKRFRYYNREEHIKSGKKVSVVTPSSPTNIKASRITLEAAGPCTDQNSQKLQQGPIVTLCASATKEMGFDTVHSEASSPQDVKVVTPSLYQKSPTSTDNGTPSPLRRPSPAVDGQTCSGQNNEGELET
ncbi:serine/threonine-protein kinase 32A-like isoform X2 [Babylonia areolata]|uniref:serine/threonine-protein kinase 32A-like isoform X2 n=1 Tax=Babylonia areolata TaxID=304850 RepID=UPI003FD51268